MSKKIIEIRKINKSSDISKPKKRVIEISRYSKLNMSKKMTLEIYSYKKFYDSFVKDIDKNKRFDLISDIKIYTLKAFYFYKSILYTDEEKLERIKGLFTKIDCNAFINMYKKTTYYALVQLGIFKDCNDIMEMLHGIIFYMEQQEGYDLKLDYDANNLIDIIYKKTLDRAIFKKQSMNRMFAIYNGNIIKTDEYIQPNKSLIGSNIMVETHKNRFISIPYKYYKQLCDICIVEFNIEVVDISEDYCDEEPIVVYETKTICSKIPSILNFIDYYDGIITGLKVIFDAQIGIMFNENCDIDVTYNDGKIEKFNYSSFCLRFLKFMKDFSEETVVI